MPIIGSSLSKRQDGTPFINPSSLSQVAGVPKDMSRATFDAAVTQERANIANNGTGIWANGEKISIFGEVGTRIWFVGSNASLSHARNVAYQGQVYALAADANMFGPTSGAPSSSVGANGDYAADGAAGLVYGPKASGTWPAGVGAVALQTQTIAQTPAASSVLGTYSSTVDDGSQTGARVTEAQRLAYMLANDGSRDLSQATPLTALPSTGNFLFMDSSGVVQLLPVSLLPSGSSGSSTGGTTATAPSQVGSLAAGTPTSTTVPLTWTAATGTAPITYAVQQSVHGANSYSNSTGSFGSTGGTVTGLTASTSYDFRVVATNSAGSSTTTLTSGISSAASSGSSGTGLTMSNATYAARGDGSGKQMLVSGTGTGPVTATFNNAAYATLKVKCRYGTTTQATRTTPFITATDNAGRVVGIVASGNGMKVFTSDFGADTGGGSINSADGAVHELAIAGIATYIFGYLDGTKVSQSQTNAQFNWGGGFTLAIDESQAPGGSFTLQLVDDQYTANGAVLATFEFDGSGART